MAALFESMPDRSVCHRERMGNESDGQRGHFSSGQLGGREAPSPHHKRQVW